jgi:hypothetical protein
MQLEPLPYMSKRYMLKRFLGMTHEEMLENEKMWQEEKGESQHETQGREMRSVGITPGGLSSDIESGESFNAEIADQGMEAMGGGETLAQASAPPPAPGPVT